MITAIPPLRGKGSLLLATLLASSILAACGTLPREQFTAEDQANAEIPGMPDVRFWADSPAASRAAAAISRQRQKDFTYLALSGGGGDGAYGVGFLNGWTETGTRPEFTVVSGVSTGALIAPFAFLGPAYDTTLKEMYTNGYGATLVDSPSFINALFGSGIFDNQNLLNLVKKFVTPDILEKVAQEHRNGRRLLIVTTNLDAQRPVIWNMGAIAASGNPDSLALFQTVMAASASVPGVFNPTLITAEGNGRYFQEMHVDGGVTANIFILPQDILMSDPRLLRGGSKAAFYVIMNGKISPDFTVVKNQTTQIAGRAITTMGQAQSQTTLRNALSFARRNGIAFNVTAIEASHPTGNSLGFDTAYMREIYAYGYERARSPTAWVKSLPQPGALETASR